MDSTFYEKFYKYMTKDTFVTLIKDTPENFQFSVKVPEIITHKKRLDVSEGAITSVCHDASYLELICSNSFIKFILDTI